ncbi:hypothetical protein Tco_0828253 [Tanacetum coccineum]
MALSPSQSIPYGTVELSKPTVRISKVKWSSRQALLLEGTYHTIGFARIVQPQFCHSIKSFTSSSFIWESDILILARLTYILAYLINGH